MRSWKSPLILLFGAILTLPVAGSGGGAARGEEVPGPVPAPSAVARIAVSVGKAHPFPWSGVDACLRPFQPGCFVVRELGPKRAVLAYTRFELDGGTLKPQGFRYLTPITPDGSGYELFPIKLGGGREEWVYAVLERAAGQGALVRFLKLPAFVTDRARLTVSIMVDAGRHWLREKYVVEADEPLTLIGLGRVERLFPSGRLEAIEVNGQAVRFPHADIIHLNLPAGEHQVTVVVGFGTRPTELTVQGTLLEPRKMSLFQSLDLRVEPDPGLAAPGLEVRTVGLPPEVWDRFRPTIVVEPAPAEEISSPLAVSYRFSVHDAITLKARPRIAVGPNNYPVMITVTTPARR